MCNRVLIDRYFRGLSYVISRQVEEPSQFQVPHAVAEPDGIYYTKKCYPKLLVIFSMHQTFDTPGVESTVFSFI